MRLPVLAVLAALTAGSASAQPRISLRVPPFAPSFDNFASVLLPEAGYEALEIRLEGTVAEIKLSTVRVLLNEMPMTPFVSVSSMPAGLRALVRVKASMSPDYSLRPGVETVLALNATDVSGVSYRAQFYVTVDPRQTEPQIAKSTRPRADQAQVQAPPQHRPPSVVFTSEWPARTQERSALLDVEATDAEGLRRLIVEVNGKDVDEVVLQNERPVRKRGGLVVRGKLPGTVEGDGHRVALSIPVRLDAKRLNVVALRVENVLGLSTRIDRTIDVQ